MVKISGTEVGHTGFGLMGFTSRAQNTPTAEAVQVMKCAVDNGATCFNGGTFYGPREACSVQLLEAYFDKYPEDASKVVLSMKAGFVRPKFRQDNSPEHIAEEIALCKKHLDGKKSIDIFQLARVTDSPSIEESMAELKKYVEKGDIKGVGLSEVTADEIRRAAAVVPIAAVEVEVSLWATDILTNGVAEACAELNIPIIAYSPLGHGFLTGQLKKFDDLPADDLRRRHPRMQPDVFDKNLELVSEVEKLAKQKGCTAGQIGLAWVRSLTGRPGLPVTLPIPGATRKDRVDENCADVQLTKEDLEEIDQILASFTPVGDRTIHIPRS